MQTMKLAMGGVVVVALFAGLTACTNRGADSFEVLLRIKNETERVEELRRKPIDEQIDVYLYAMKRKPPYVGFARYLASNGESMVPHVLNRLAAEKDDWNKAHLIHLLRTMAEANVPIKENAALIDLVKVQISQMNGASAALAHEELDRIIKGVPPHKPQ